MKTINDLIPEDQGAYDLMLARAYSINEYVLLEEALASLYSALLGGGELESVVWSFHKLSTRDRVTVLEDLWKKRADQRTERFGTSVIRHVEGLARQRNFIVHSHQVAGAVAIDLATGKRSKEFKTFLLSPGLVFDLPGEKKYFLPDVLRFARQVAFHRQHVTVLHHLLLGQCLPEWKEIVTQKYCSDPLPGQPAFEIWSRT